MIEIYTDGACEPNPGNGGWAWACKDCGETDSGEPGRITTNNEMEMYAVLKAIEHGKTEHKGEVIKVYSDSKYCVNGFNRWSKSWAANGWKKRDHSPIKNLSLWKELYSLNNNVILEWVKGHAGDHYNEKVDSLAVDAMIIPMYDDNTLLDWGKKYKGKKLGEIPASYLLFHYDNGNFDHFTSMRQYIELDIEELRKEAQLEREE